MEIRNFSKEKDEKDKQLQQHDAKEGKQQNQTAFFTKMPGNILPSPSTSLLRACADRDFRLLGDRAGGERFLSPMVQVSECVHLEIHASSYVFRFTMFF